MSAADHNFVENATPAYHGDKPVQYPSPDLAAKYDRYNAHRDRLAQTLYEFVYGPGTWANVDESKDDETDLRAFYTADAEETLSHLPHLLPFDSRLDME